MYGEAGYFQKDILLSQFFGREIRPGEGIANVLLLDEVDNMMIDNAVKTLYISHRMTDMRYLKDVFIHIWAAVNGKERVHSEENIRKISQYIKQLIGHCQDITIDRELLKEKLTSIPKELYCNKEDVKKERFPTLVEPKEDEIRKFCLGESSVILKGEWDIKLQDKEVRSKDDLLDAMSAIVKGDEELLTSEQEINIKLLIEKLGFATTEVTELDEYKISIQSTLNEFVDRNLRSWIENAYSAKYITDNDQYIIGDA